MAPEYGATCGFFPVDRAQQEARMAAKTSGDDAGEDKPIHQSLSKGNSIKKNQSLDKISEVFGGGGAIFKIH